MTWEKYVHRAPGWQGWISPVALGLAISIQQDSWFLVPCFIVAVYQEARLYRQRPWPAVVRYGLIVGSTFIILNLPFIVLGPFKWVHGILEPFALSLMPLGQGLIGLTTYLGIGGGDLSLYSLTSVLVLTAVLCVIGFHYRRARFLVPLTPAIVLWFSTRSLSQYVLIAGYAILAALCCWDAELPPLPYRNRHRKSRGSLSRRTKLFGGLSLGSILIVVATTASLGSLAMALTSKPPLSIQVVSYHSTGQEQTIDSLKVQVRNNTNDRKYPVFVVEDGPYVGTPWLLIGKPI